MGPNGYYKAGLKYDTITLQFQCGKNSKGIRNSINNSKIQRCNLPKKRILTPCQPPFPSCLASSFVLVVLRFLLLLPAFILSCHSPTQPLSFGVLIDDIDVEMCRLKASCRKTSTSRKHPETGFYIYMFLLGIIHWIFTPVPSPASPPSATQ